MRKPTALRVALWIPVWVLIGACSRSDRATFGPEKSAAEPGRAVVWGADPLQRYGQQRMGAPSAPAQAAAKVHYDMPAGWKELAPRQFRDLNLQVGGDPAAECYLTLGLSGSVAENLNRWRGQVGQPSVDPAQLEALPRVTFLGVEAYLLEVEGTGDKAGTMLMGLLAPVGGGISTLKMTGPSDVLQAERQGFLALAGSIHLSDGETGGQGTTGTGGSASANGAGGSENLTRWKAPDDWVKTGDRPMREVTFQVGEQTECYVSVLGGDGGGLRPNLDRWCGQMGQAALSDEELASLPTVAMLGSQGLVARIHGSYTGMSGENIPDAAMLVATCFLPAKAVFVKMIGPAAEVDAHREQFLQFCSSLEG